MNTTESEDDDNRESGEGRLPCTTLDSPDAVSTYSVPSHDIIHFNSRFNIFRRSQRFYSFQEPNQQCEIDDKFLEEEENVMEEDDEEEEDEEEVEEDEYEDDAQEGEEIDTNESKMMIVVH